MLYNILMDGPRLAFVFDVDGVIADPASQNPNYQVIEKVAQLIDSGVFLAFITGRSVKWLTNNVLLALEQKVSSRANLSNLYVSCEFGGTTAPPPAFSQKAAEIFSSYKDFMWQEEKETMLTFVVRAHFPIDEYHKRRRTLINEFNKLIHDLNLSDSYEVHTDLLSVNIKHKLATKKYAAKKFIEFLKGKAEVDKFIVLGDSQSDTEMAEELQDKYSTEFVFVGDESKLDRSKLHCPVVFTNTKYGEGTLEYLRSILP